jgi:hypothetical protein
MGDWRADGVVYTKLSDGAVLLASQNSQDGVSFQAYFETRLTR